MNAQEAYELIIKAGDFSKAHSGNHPVPTDLLGGLRRFTEEDFDNALHTGKVALAKAKVLLAEAEPNQLDDKRIQAVCELDKFHSYIHGLGILFQLWLKSRIKQKISKACELEVHFAHLLLHFGKEKQLTGELARQALKVSDRRHVPNSLEWTNDIESNSAINN